MKQMADRWFSYTSDDGVEFHKTEEEARARIEYEMDKWSDGIPDCPEEHCIGKVTASIVETERRDADPDSEFKFIAQYELKEIEDPS